MSENETRTDEKRKIIMISPEEVVKKAKEQKFISTRERDAAVALATLEVLIGIENSIRK